MLRQIFAFLAVAVSVAFATTCGYCYSGYGGYVNGVSSLTGGAYNSGFYGSRVLSTGCATPIVSSGLYATPTYTATVGGPEVISSCENSVGSTGLVSSGLYGSEYYGSRYGLGYGYGATLGGCRTGAIATTF